VLTVRPQDVVPLRTVVAEADGVVVGHYMIEGGPPEAELEQLFVDPAHIGRGVGRLLWEHAVAAAAAEGIRTLVVAADPFAEGFYLAMGAARAGVMPSTVLASRELPRLTFAVPSA
jgi:GNAT superfamily N-acetyltransferase